MAFIDYYKILGIDKSATEKDIKAAYRKLARKFHPDLNPNDAEANKKFQQINEANEVLGDPEKRKKYDKYGEHWQHGEEHEQYARQQQQRGQQYSGFGGGQGQGFESFEGFGDSGDFSDFFRSMFGGSGGGGGSRQRGRQRGQDFTAELRLSLREASETHKQTLSVNDRQIRITIPAGVENGQTIKIAGYGGPGANNGTAGDLYITFIILDDPQFKKVGSDLYNTVKVDLYTAVLGGEITVDTMTGKVKLKVAPGTQNGTKVKLKGKGFPVYKKAETFGNLFLTYDIEIPTNLSNEQKEMFAELAKLK